MEFHAFLLPALERVLAWDLPDEAYGDAVAHEAQLMAGNEPDRGSCTWDD